MIPDLVLRNPRLLLAWSALNEIDDFSVTAWRRGRHDVEIKTDGSPVTAVEKSIEEMLTSRISAAFPRDSIIGEESGEQLRGSGTWIIDPIDGTSNFLEGIPAYAHMIAFMSGRSTVFALVSAPAMAARWWAVAGSGAYRGCERVAVSGTSELGAARICYGGLRDYSTGDASRLVELVRQCRRSRAFGNFLPAMLVAEGTYDVAAAAPGDAVWDLAPVEHIVREAGGQLTSFSGGAPDPTAPVLTSNGTLHPRALGVLSPS